MVNLVFDKQTIPVELDQMESVFQTILQQVHPDMLYVVATFALSDHFSNLFKTCSVVTLVDGSKPQTLFLFPGSFIDNHPENSPDLMCPICDCVMTQPFMLHSGQSADKVCLEKTIQVSGKNPFNRESITLRDIHPNLGLKNVIETFWKKRILHYNDCDVIKKVKTAKDSLQVIAVVDVSGSMGEREVIKTVSDNLSLSRLELVQFALSVMISSFAKSSRHVELSLVTFDSCTKTPFQCTQLNNPRAEASCLETINRLVPGDTTNLRAAIQESIRIAKSCESNTDKHIILFSDGQPDFPGFSTFGWSAFMQSQISQDIKLHTIGFSTQVNSTIMANIASAGNGSFCYVHDYTMIGTTFVHLIAHLLSNTSIQQSLSAREIQCSQKLVALAKHSLHVNEHIGVIENALSPRLLRDPKTSTLCLFSPSGSKTLTQCVIQLCTDVFKEWIPTAADLIFRSFCSFVTATPRPDVLLVHQFVENSATISAAQFFKNCCEFAELELEITRLIRLFSADDECKPFLQELCSADPLQGQVRMAMMPEYFSTWGKHYLEAFISAHEHHLCSDFRSPSVQMFGRHDAFQSTLAFVNEILMQTPVPQPSISRLPVSQPSGSQPFVSQPSGSQPSSSQPFLSRGCQPIQQIVQPARPMIAASDLVNPRGACMDGDCCVMVRTFHNDAVKYVIKTLCHLEKGDVVACDLRFETLATVQCVVQSTSDTPFQLIEVEPGIKLTPYHPFQVKGENWKFPASCPTLPTVYKHQVFNLVLDTCHTVCLFQAGKKVLAVTLAHGKTDNEIVQHSFFGTSNVLTALQKVDPLGFQNGRVMLDDSITIQRNADGFVCDFVFSTLK